MSPLREGIVRRLEGQRFVRTLPKLTLSNLWWQMHFLDSLAKLNCNFPLPLHRRLCIGHFPFHKEGLRPSSDVVLLPCRNSGIKFDKSTAEARRLNQTFELSSTSAVVLHGSGTAEIQTFINYINVFWRDCVPTGSSEKNCYEASVNPEFGSTLKRRLNWALVLGSLI